MPAAPAAIFTPAGNSPAQPVAPPSAATTPAPANVGTVLATPGAPAAPVAPPSAGLTPTPANTGTVQAMIGNPAAPIAPSRTAAAPATPPAVYEAQSNNVFVVSGALTPPISGSLRVSAPKTGAYPGSIAYSSDGQSEPPESGPWMQFYQPFLVSPEAATLAQIAPPAGYTASGSRSSASEVQVFDGSSWMIYWLYTDGVTARWCDASNAGLSSQDSTVIPSGRFLYPVRVSGGGGFSGGLGQTWQDSPSAASVWYLLAYTGNHADAYWQGVGQIRPVDLTWTPKTGATGTPVLTFTGLAAPVALPTPGATPITPAAIT